jgi:hypothetical protein
MHAGRQHGVLPEIEVFDLSHIYGARKLLDLGLINDHPHVQFVMGIKNALPAERRILDFLHSELKRVLPNATWTAAGIAIETMSIERTARLPTRALGRPRRGRPVTSLSSQLTREKSLVAKCSARPRSSPHISNGIF